MSEALGTVHIRGRELLRGPVSPKLVFEQIVAPVPEIMDGYLYFVDIIFLRMYIYIMGGGIDA
jgi:hypothetical protein